MSEERKQILKMVADGTITVDEGERLLAALAQQTGAGESPAAERAEPMESPEPDTSLGSKPGNKPKFLYVKVNSKPGSSHKHENVNIKIPLLLLKAGVKLSALVPDKARGELSSHLSDHGIDLDLKKLKSTDLDALVQALTESSIDVDADHETVKIYCA